MLLGLGGTGCSWPGCVLECWGARLLRDAWDVDSGRLIFGEEIERELVRWRPTLAPKWWAPPAGRPYVPVMTRPLTGLIVPLVTPFDSEDRVDLACLQRLATHVLDAGASGLAALATTGEAHALDDAERDLVTAACAEVCADRAVPLLVGAGTYDTRLTIRRHEALGRYTGVTHSLAVVPYYVRPSEAAIIDHFAVVAARSPVPMVIYNIPYRTGRGLGAASIMELAEVDNIVGLKQAVGSVDDGTLAVLTGVPDTFSVLAGDDLFIAPVVLMGGSGAIAASAHICTAMFADMVRAGLAGDTASSRRLAGALLPLVTALFAEPSPAVIKALLHSEGLIPTPRLRMPLTDASAAAIEAARAARDMALRAAGSADERVN